MRDQPDLSRFSLRLTITAPLDRRFEEPDGWTFDRYDLALLRHDLDAPEPVGIATAVLFRIRPDSGAWLVDAVDAEASSALLEHVCMEALDEDGEPRPAIEAALPDLMVQGVLVLDNLVFSDPADAVPLLYGLVARGVLDLLGRVGDVIFLPEPDRLGATWSRAVGAVRAGGFVVASNDLVLPDFPLAST